MNALGITLEKCAFADNVAESDGGGFIVFGDNEANQEVYIRESTFDRNEAVHGGASWRRRLGECLDSTSK